MALFGILMGIVLLATALFLLAGWTIPMTVALVWRSRGRSGARAWGIFAAAWGGIALVVLATIGGAYFWYFRSLTAFDRDAGNTPAFDAVRSGKPTATLKTAFAGQAELLAQADDGKSLRMTTSNGLFTVPSGKLAVRSYTAVIKDAQGRTWTASCRGIEDLRIEAAPGAEAELAVGPPLAASVKVAASAASDGIELEPAYGDRHGREYDVTSTPRCDNPPQFQFINAAGSVTWSGKFEFG